MRLKKIAAATAIALAATGTATLATSSPAQAFPRGLFPAGGYAQLSVCNFNGQLGEEKGRWDYYICYPLSSGYELFVHFLPGQQPL